MSWKDYASIDEKTYKILYKGVDIGLSNELVHDFANAGIEIPDEDIERLYNNSIIILRDKRIDEILS